MKTEKVEKSKLIKRILMSLLVSVLIPISVVISVPFEIFSNNYSEFAFALSDFLPVLIGFFFLFTFIFFIAIMFLPKRAYRIACSILIAFAFMCFIQGNYLNGALNSLSGDNLGGVEVSTLSKVLNALIWLFVIAIAVVLACLKDKKNIISYISIVVCWVIIASQIISPISISITQPKIFYNSEKKINYVSNSDTHYILSEKNLNTVSSEGNIYIFCIDKFDEEFAETAYQDNPEIFNNLTGFTWFQDHLASYTHTFPSIVELLTGNTYDAKLSRVQYINESYKNEKNLSILNDNGYDINIYTQPFHCFTDASNMPEFISNREKTLSIKVSNKAMLSFSMIGLAFYRVLPTFLKKIIRFDSSTSNQYVQERDQDNNLRYDTNKFNKKEITTKNGKGFYFIHTDGCHAASSNNLSKGAKLAKNNFEIIDDYINCLKSEGLYENATIIITGDHSAGNYNGKLVRSERTALFVKPSSKNSEKMEFSNAPTCHKNLWATIFESAGIKTDEDYGDSVFEIKEDEQFERTLISHSYAKKLVAITYKITGSAKDFKNWEKVDEVYYNKTLTD